MKKAIFTMLLCVSAVLTGWAQQTVKVGSIEELRSLEKGTSVVLTMACDTVLSTLDGGLCLSGLNGVLTGLCSLCLCCLCRGSGCLSGITLLL